MEIIIKLFRFHFLVFFFCQLLLLVNITESLFENKKKKRNYKEKWDLPNIGSKPNDNQHTS